MSVQVSIENVSPVEVSVSEESVPVTVESSDSQSISIQQGKPFDLTTELSNSFSFVATNPESSISVEESKSVAIEIDGKVGVSNPAANFQIGANAGLSLENNTLSTIYNTNLASGLAVPAAVGGIDAGTTVEDLNTKTIVGVLNDLLFPTVLASISPNKSVTLTTASGGIYEVGTPLDRTLTANFNAGRIINGDGTTGPDLVGAATGYTFTGTGISETNQSGNTLDITWNVVLGDNDWDVTVTHNAGTGTYTDNKGNTGTNLDSIRASGTVTDTNTYPDFTGRYRLFYGTGGSTATGSTDVRALSSVYDTSNTFTLVTGDTDTKFKIALPPNRTIVSVIDTGNLNANVTSEYVLSTIDVYDAGGTLRTYNYYEANYDSPYSTSTNHVVTITGTSN